MAIAYSAMTVWVEMRGGHGWAKTTHRGSTDKRALDAGTLKTRALPADVWADTSTDSPCSKQFIEVCWNASRGKAYSRAGGPGRRGGGRSGSGAGGSVPSGPGGSTRSYRHVEREEEASAGPAPPSEGRKRATGGGIHVRRRRAVFELQAHPPPPKLGREPRGAAGSLCAPASTGRPGGPHLPAPSPPAAASTPAVRRRPRAAPACPTWGVALVSTPKP